MGWRLNGVLTVHDPAQGAPFAVYCEELRMRFTVKIAVLVSIDNNVENKLVNLHKRKCRDLAELQNPADFVKIHCTKSTKKDKIETNKAAYYAQ